MVGGWFSFIGFGAVVFWCCDALLTLLAWVLPVTLWIVLKTCCLPLATLGSYIYFSKHWRFPIHAPVRPLLMLFGIWLFGPPYLCVLSFFSGKGNIPLEGLGDMMLYFPMVTFSMSAYSGALFALIITSVLLLVFTGIELFKKIKS